MHDPYINEKNTELRKKCSLERETRDQRCFMSSIRQITHSEFSDNVNKIENNRYDYGSNCKKLVGHTIRIASMRLSRHYAIDDGHYY